MRADDVAGGSGDLAGEAGDVAGGADDVAGGDDYVRVVPMTWRVESCRPHHRAIRRSPGATRCEARSGTGTARVTLTAPPEGGGGGGWVVRQCSNTP